jgi:hypothetical protein
MFLACDLFETDDDIGDPNNPGNTVTPVGELVTTGTYTQTTIGGKTAIILTVNSPLSIDTSADCNGDILEVEYDTTPAQTSIDTTVYELNGNQLVILESGYDTIETAVILGTTCLTRKGTGTTITGVWHMDSISYRIISGTLSTADKAELDAEIAQQNVFMKSILVDIQLTGTEMKYYVSYQMSEILLQSFLVQAEFFDTCLAMTYAVSGANSIKITGGLSGEVVTITMDAKTQDMTYTSSVAGHAEYTDYGTPVSCPNEGMPEWYEDFLVDNFKMTAECIDLLSGGTEKARVGHPIIPDMNNIIRKLFLH